MPSVKRKIASQVPRPNLALAADLGPRLCPECGLDPNAVRALVRAMVPRPLHAELKADAARLGVRLETLVIAKLRQPIARGKVCRTCDRQPNLRSRAGQERLFEARGKSRGQV